MILLMGMVGCLTPSKVINRIQTDPKFSTEMQNRYTALFPCIIKDSLVYKKGNTYTNIPDTIPDSIAYSHRKWPTWRWNRY
jgi:hypothetical protein